MLDSLGINLMVVPVQAVLFTILLIVMWKFFFTRVAGAMNQREHEVEKVLHDIQSKQAHVEKQMTDYTRRIQEIEQQVTLKIQEAVKEGQRIKADIEAEAKKRADEELAKGKQAIQREREQAMVNLQRESAKLAQEIAQRILQEPVAGEARKKAGVS
jgi:F-type H+-transporting ATPase subunit b